eukprot:TRINITY_DN1514_c0_g1_i2.p2 TRINITY_DN1514_c0_g1~~TRINITY_DN1514_c0_g1_i2.p2  ORF type:complete len:220 (+),score=45.26 TRINITY_DN1514_c0_g1_i2:860-1519(+)
MEYNANFGLLLVHSCRLLLFSEYVIGFDLVDEEDRYNTLYYYVPDFLQIQYYLQENNLPPIKYFFHGGETDWANRMNLYDAILLNTTRIGHAYALKDYPLLKEMVKNRGIGLELCPVSNQLLRLVSDLRNHPGCIYMNEGLPITISNDDPSIYSNIGLSWDFYETYMACNNMGLAGLKQLSLNSLLYSQLNSTEMAAALEDWEERWSLWVKQVHYSLMQ